MSSDKKPPRKKFIADLTDDDLYAEEPPVRDDTSDVDDKPTIQADTSDVTDKPTIQADASAVDDKVADTSAVTDKPTIQADASDVDDKPTIQADTSAVDDKPTIQADTSDVDDKPTIQADASDVTEKPPVETDASAVDDKPTIQADTSAVDDKPTIQADTSAVTDNARRRTFHSKHFAKNIDDNSHAEDKPEGKRKISHAEASGILISVVMLGYSLVTEDKPLFFLSTALLIFLLRPIIGGLFGKHSQNVQNGLHAFSIALFVGALVFLFF